MNKILLSVLLAACTATAVAQTNVVPLEKGSAVPQNHVVYFLPRTEIVVSVEQQKVIRRAGRFANYAKRFLSLNDVVIKDTSFYRIAKVDITDRQIPDSTKRYAVSITPKSVAYKIKTDKQGIIRSVNTDIAVETVSDSAIRGLSAADTTSTFDYSLLEQAALEATSEEKTAQLVARQILDIRESRADLLSGEDKGEFDVNSLNKMLEKLDAAERSLTELFAGKTQYYTERKIFRIVPQQSITDEVVCRFSPRLGVVDKDDYAGEPIYISVKSADMPAPSTAASKSKKNGIYYNIAPEATVVVSALSGKISEGKYLFPQFGYATAFPAKMFDKPTISVVLTKYGTIDYIK